jgi:hypothetical protein
MAGAFLSLGRVLPDGYPLRDDLEVYLVNEHGLGRTLDYGVIGPRLQALYDWSAGELGLPGLRRLVRDGADLIKQALEDASQGIGGEDALGGVEAFRRLRRGHPDINDGKVRHSSAVRRSSSSAAPA